MSYLYQEIANVPGLSGSNTYQKQADLYGKIGLPGKMGSYSGSYDQNMALLNSIKSNNYYKGGIPGSTPSAASGAAAPALPTAIDFANSQNAQQQQQTNSILAPIKSTYSDYSAAAARLQNPLDMYKQFSTEQGLPEQQVAVNRLRSETNRVTDLLNNLEGDVYNRTGGVLMTDAQRRNVISSEGLPLSRQLSSASGALGVAQSGLTDTNNLVGNLVNLGVAGNAQSLRPYQISLEGMGVTAPTEISQLNARLGNSQTGYNTERSLAEQILAEQRTLANEKDLAKFKSGLGGGGNISSLLQALLGGGATTTEAKPAAPPTNYKTTLDQIFTNPAAGGLLSSDKIFGTSGLSSSPYTSLSSSSRPSAPAQSIASTPLFSGYQAPSSALRLDNGLLSNLQNLQGFGGLVLR